MSAVPLLVRERCLTCTHSYDPRELLSGLCSNCLVARIKALDKGNLTDAVAKAVCQECNRSVLARAYAHWDVGANDFAYLCIHCGDKAIAKAEQYRGTKHGYLHKAE